MSSVGIEYPKEQARCRELLKIAESLPIGSGWFMIGQLRALIKESEEAWASGDLARQLKVFQEMRATE